MTHQLIKYEVAVKALAEAHQVEFNLGRFKRPG